MLCLLSSLILGGNPAPIELSYDSKQSAQVIRVDMKSPRARIGMILPPNFPGTDETFESMIKRTQPTAAINGAYFSTDNLNPIGDIVSDGKAVHEGRMGTAFMIDGNGKPDILRVIRHKTYIWGGYRLVLACGPALVLDGKVDVDWKTEGFRDPSVTGKAARMGIGYTKEGQLILVRIQKAVTFESMALTMEKLGCFEAMNLDAGASQGMYFNGKYQVKPSRRLTNVLGVWISPE